MKTENQKTDQTENDLAYQVAVEHIGFSMWAGRQPYQVMASVGVPAPIDASWNQALGVIWSKSMEFVV